MKIKILAEGSTKWQRFVRHWGLSIMVGDDLLFDTFGKADYIMRQMTRFRIDLSKLRYIVISHDDWDHVAGLENILKKAHEVKVYICPRSSSVLKMTANKLKNQVIEPKGVTKIKDGVFLSGELSGGSHKGAPIYEQYLAVKGKDGLNIITGCAHPGIVEIVQHAKATFAEDANMIIGGFHLKDNSYKTNIAICEKLKALGVRHVVPMHCTGRDAVNILRGVFGHSCLTLKTGKSLEI